MLKNLIFFHFSQFTSKSRLHPGCQNHKQPQHQATQVQVVADKKEEECPNQQAMTLATLDPCLRLCS